MILRWVIWYDDGSTYSSDDGAPETAPLDGIQGIREWDDEGTTARYLARDYYEWTGDGWRCGDLSDLEKWLRHDRPQLKYGRWAPHGVWRRISAAVKREW